MSLVTLLLSVLLCHDSVAIYMINKELLDTSAYTSFIYSFEKECITISRNGMSSVMSAQTNN